MAERGGKDTTKYKSRIWVTQLGHETGDKCSTYVQLRALGDPQINRCLRSKKYLKG